MPKFFPDELEQGYLTCENLESKKKTPSFILDSQGLKGGLKGGYI